MGNTWVAPSQAFEKAAHSTHGSVLTEVFLFHPECSSQGKQSLPAEAKDRREPLLRFGLGVLGSRPRGLSGTGSSSKSMTPCRLKPPNAGLCLK